MRLCYSKNARGFIFFFFQAEDGIRDRTVTGAQTCALPIFSPKSNFQGAHENLHLVERWERVDSDTIRYTVTIEDPTVWTKPWTVTHDLKKQKDEDNRSEEHTSELQSPYDLVCRLLLEKKKK